MEVLQSLPSAVTLVLGLLLVAWLVLLLLVPFMIESIRSSTRKAHLELEAINDKLDKLTAILERDNVPTLDAALTGEPRKDARREASPSPAPTSDRTRREPTISG